MGLNGEMKRYTLSTEEMAELHRRKEAQHRRAGKPEKAAAERSRALQQENKQKGRQ